MFIMGLTVGIVAGWGLTMCAVTWLRARDQKRFTPPETGRYIGNRWYGPIPKNKPAPPPPPPPKRW